MDVTICSSIIHSTLQNFRLLSLQRIVNTSVHLLRWNSVLPSFVIFYIGIPEAIYDSVESSTELLEFQR